MMSETYLNYRKLRMHESDCPLCRTAQDCPERARLWAVYETSAERLALSTVEEVGQVYHESEWPYDEDPRER